MTQSELNDAVCVATGEDLSEVRHRGFSLVDPSDAAFDSEPDELPAQTLDWDTDESARPMPVAADFETFLKRSA